jgi:hypothetical protein
MQVDSKRSAKVAKLMEWYCKKVRVDVADVVFLHDGTKIDGEKTIDEVGQF